MRFRRTHTILEEEEDKEEEEKQHLYIQIMT